MQKRDELTPGQKILISASQSAESSNAESNPVGRLFTVRETAKILGLCLDSVRRHLRSGHLPGVRVGRSWRVPEKVLLAHLGLATLSLATPPIEIEEDSKLQSAARKTTDPTVSSVARNTSETLSSVAMPLGSQATQKQIKELVERAARHADLSQRATQRLLAEFDDLLHA